MPVAAEGARASSQLDARAVKKAKHKRKTHLSQLMSAMLRSHVARSQRVSQQELANRAASRAVAWKAIAAQALLNILRPSRVTVGPVPRSVRSCGRKLAVSCQQRQATTAPSWHKPSVVRSRAIQQQLLVCRALAYTLSRAAAMQRTQCNAFGALQGPKSRKQQCIVTGTHTRDKLAYECNKYLCSELLYGLRAQLELCQEHTAL